MFQLIKNGNSLRFLNIEDYADVCIEKIEGSGEILIGFVTFNNPVMAADISKYLSKSGHSVVVIDNNSILENYTSLCRMTADLSNVHIIRTKENIGGAGGYALLCEVFLRSNFKYLLLTEDDAIPAELDLLNELINCRMNGDIISCQYYNNNSISFSFHFTLYSRRLMLECGVPDPRFFQGGDDADFLRRQRIVLAKNDWYHVSVCRGYHHPTLKGSGTPAKVIRSQRNALMSEFDSKKYIPAMVRVVAFLSYAFYYLLSGNIHVFRSAFFSWLDIAKMGSGRDPYIGDACLNQSQDRRFNFKRVKSSQIKGVPGTVHLKQILAPIGFDRAHNLILTTLDSPWTIINAPFYSNSTIIKNLSDDLMYVELCEFRINMKFRFICIISILIAIFFAPIHFFLYAVFYFLFFKLR